jgi:hypothetical protein
MTNRLRSSGLRVTAELLSSWSASRVPSGRLGSSGLLDLTPPEARHVSTVDRLRPGVPEEQDSAAQRDPMPRSASSRRESMSITV